MTKFEFYLSDSMADKLFDCKEREGKDNMTGNDYARELLEGAIRHTEWILKHGTAQDDKGN